MFKMIQLGAFILDTPVFGNVLSGAAKKGTDIAGYLVINYVDKGIDIISKRYITGKASGITLTNNEMRDIIKVIKPVENRGIL